MGKKSMKSKRMLNEAEKALTEKNIKAQKEILKYYAYLMKYATLMLDKGLRLNFDKQKKEAEAKLQKLVGNSRTEWNDFEIEYTELLISDGLEQNFKKAIREQKEQLAEILREFNTTKMTIEIAEKQINEGVGGK
jgi:hypothetical protein